MTKKVALIEFPIYEQYPILSGYLHGYACTNNIVQNAYQFEYYQESVNNVLYESTLEEIKKLDASIYCFSCYVWNIGLIKRLIEDLQSDFKVKKIILGGHQVSNHISHYIKPEQNKVIVVNGPGEEPFKDILLALEEKIELTSISGISTFVDRELYDGGFGEFITDLDSIPSPFLEGFFDNFQYPITIFETNRGCPFQCSFCTWGGPTNKVTKFSLDRLKEELTWIAKNNVFFIFLADANWGMLPRDIEISEYIGWLKNEYGTPWGVYYAASKNTPDRSMDCIKAFHKSGVITSQAIGIQSLNARTLEAINRKNIKNESYFRMFEELQNEGISSYCELIWPLPEEDLQSLKNSFQKLLALKAQTIILYPTILINNAKLTRDAKKYNMLSTEALDWKSELKLVKSTNTASQEDVNEGFWFYYSHFLLGNCDGYKSLYKFSENILGISSIEIISKFSAFLQIVRFDSSYSKLLRQIFENNAHGDLNTIGELATHLLHEYRLESQKLVADFLAYEFDKEPLLRVYLIVLWLATLPKIFSNSSSYVQEIVSSLDVQGFENVDKIIQIKEDGKTLIIVKKNMEAFVKVLTFFNLNIRNAEVSHIEIREPSNSLEKMAFTPENKKHNLIYAHGIINRLGEITPDIIIRNFVEI